MAASYSMVKTWLGSRMLCCMTSLALMDTLRPGMRASKCKQAAAMETFSRQMVTMNLGEAPWF